MKPAGLRVLNPLHVIRNAESDGVGDQECLMYMHPRISFQRFKEKLKKEFGVRPGEGYREWKTNLKKIRDSTEIHNLEKLFALSVHFLHIVTVSGWIKISWDPDPNSKTTADVAHRNRVVETWVMLEFIALVLATLGAAPIGSGRIIIASYFLFEILLNLCSIVFVGKLEDVYPVTPSIERSLLLFGVNVLQIILIFAIFYRAAFGSQAREAIFQASLVLATVGYPDLDPQKHFWWIVTLQSLTDLVLLIVFLGAFVGNLKAFKR